MVKRKRNILFAIMVNFSIFCIGQKIKFIEIYNEDGFVEKKKSNDNNANNLINEFYLSNIENTKLYWSLLRCLKYKPEERIYLYI